jgi:hypothetical protein
MNLWDFTQLPYPQTRILKQNKNIKKAPLPKKDAFSFFVRLVKKKIIAQQHCSYRQTRN